MRLLAAVALLLATAGCKDDENPAALGEPALLSIQNAAADAEVITVESPKKQTLDIRVEAEQISGNYITVVFKTAPELVGTYNAAHGTSYKLCPSEAYAFSTTEVMLPRYNTVSSTMKVELFSERMPDEEPYLLPIAIDSIKGDPRATVSPTGSVRYILFNKLVKPGPPAPVLLDRSGWKVLAAPKAKPNYEVEKMFDEDINTFGYCNADEEQANPPYDFVIDLGKEVTVRGFQFNQRYMTTGKPEAGARYGIAHLEVWTAKEITGDGTKRELTLSDGSIRFDHVYFKYHPDSAEWNLTDIDFSIASGMTVGILGGTGSAKSTLVSLIPRLYEATEGAVYVGGHNVKDYTMETLREGCAMVLQKNTLFSGTIRDNLRWGDENATGQEMEAACRMACADEFISRMPDGYDTRIEQGGTNVSGGQKQRLCIARAILRKPKVLILDDSTSAVDTKTDALIRKAFLEEIPDTTKFIIAQRVSSIEDADKILVMDGGQIVAMGTHDELLKTCDIYRETYESQMKGGSDNEQ